MLGGPHRVLKLACITISILFPNGQVIRFLNTTLNGMMTSFKISEIVDWPTINNALQINRLQPCANLSKAQAIHTSTGMDIV
jgi:hypothetical protein